MATKTLNTRVALRYDSYENWLTNDPVLLAGEIALASVSVKQDGDVQHVPSVLIKCGNGTSKYSELDYVYAKAADVLTACKTEAGLTAFVTNVINNSGIATTEGLSALAGRVTTAEGEIDTLQSEMDAVEVKAAANETAIGELETLVGDEAVATQIANKIAELKLGETYDAKGAAAAVQTALDTYKTSNDAAVLANKNSAAANTSAIEAIKDGTTIDSFADVETALNGKEVAGAAATAEANAKDYADSLAGNYDAKGAAATAEANAKTYAKDYADSLAGNYDAAGSAADALADAKEYTNGEIAEWVGDKSVSEQIAALNLANTYAAKVHTHVKADITDFAHTHEIAEVNGLQGALDGKQAAGDYATKAEAQGYADAKDEAIEAAQAAADKAQDEVDALETYVGTIPEGYTESNVVAYINKKAEETLASAQGGSSESAASVLAALNTYKAENDPKVTANTEAIADLEGLVGETAVSAQIAAVTDPLGNRVKAIEDDYLKAADKTELQGNIDTVSAAVERLTNGVSAEEVDGVNDLIQYVKDHGTEVTGMKEDISDNADAIAAEKERAEGVEGGLDTRLQAVEAAVGESGSVAGDIADALTEAKEYTDAEVKELADGAVATNAADIEALEGLVGGVAVATQINNAVDALKTGELKTMQGEIDAVEGRADALEAKAHEHANKDVLDGIEAADITAWDAKVDGVTAAADSGLKATRTGNDIAIEIDDTLTWVFDCGDSSNV